MDHNPLSRISHLFFNLLLLFKWYIFWKRREKRCQNLTVLYERASCSLYSEVVCAFSLLFLNKATELFPFWEGSLWDHYFVCFFFFSMRLIVKYRIEVGLCRFRLICMMFWYIQTKVSICMINLLIIISFNMHASDNYGVILLLLLLYIFLFK